jgi:isoleucyl-tRNA synthetase
MIGNLFDFDPAKDISEASQMQEIDRYAMHRLQELVEKVRKAYDGYDFHVIYHAIYNYCTVDLSAFYLDVLKDRLYTSPQVSASRRSAQTAVYHILEALARIMAPILPFTAEEIWSYMPGGGESQGSIHLEALPDPDPAFTDPQLAEKWKMILAVRGEVTRALETARTDKLIGHPLDASVTVYFDNSMYDSILPYAESLRSIFIVSEAGIRKGKAEADAYESEELEGLQVLVGKADGVKCERCWVYDRTVGSIEQHPNICRRCNDALEAS